MKKRNPKIQVDMDDQSIEEAVLQLAPIFRMFGWTWFDAGEGDQIPTANEIRKTIEHLIKDVVDNDWEYCSTGRITVTRQSDGEFYNLAISLDLSQVYDERDK